MSDTTGTPEDAERAAQIAFAKAKTDWFDGNRPGPLPDRPFYISAFIDGFLAARPSVTVDEITELLAGHEPTYWTHGDGTPVGCACMDRVFIKGRESWSEHLASVIVAHITGEGA